MLGYFCAPYPDELLYSVCARLSDRVAFPCAQHTLVELFGTPNAMIGVDLPSYLQYFVRVIPHGHGYTTDQLIEQHTLLPFYEPFLDLSRSATIRERMKTGGRHGFQFLLGSKGPNLNKPDWLRYCPRCVESDRNQYGECYWHRVHQIPGVLVCPDHGIWLENSTAPARGLRACHTFRSAEGSIVLQPPRRLAPDQPGSTAIAAFAKNAQWLIEHPQKADSAGVRRRYLALLAERGLATYRGQVSAQRLCHEFLTYYPNAVLERFEGHGGSLSDGRAVLALVHRYETQLSPIHHLLLIQFLGHTVESLFRLPSEPQYFGNGPWPCLNRAARHYGERVIDRCEIQMSTADGRPVGVFRCRCGFGYSRVGPDWSPMMECHIGRVLDYGVTWDRKLKELWLESGLCVDAIAQRLGVSPPTLRSQVRRLGLSLRRIDARARMRLPSARRWSKPAIVWALSEIPARRRRWLMLSTMRNRSWATLRERRRLSTWLQRHDRLWFRAHPANRAKGFVGVVGRGNVDWDARDREYAELVETTADRLRKHPGRPIFLSRARIIQHTGHQRIMAPHLTRLPRTRRVFARVVETRIAYRLRLINWAAWQLSAGDEPPSRTALLALIGGKRISNSHSEVARAIDTVLLRLMGVRDEGAGFPAESTRTQQVP